MHLLKAELERKEQQRKSRAPIPPRMAGQFPQQTFPNNQRVPFEGGRPQQMSMQVGNSNFSQRASMASPNQNFNQSQPTRRAFSPNFQQPQQYRQNQGSYNQNTFEGGQGGRGRGQQFPKPEQYQNYGRQPNQNQDFNSRQFPPQTNRAQNYIQNNQRNNQSGFNTNYNMNQRGGNQNFNQRGPEPYQRPRQAFTQEDRQERRAEPFEHQESPVRGGYRGRGFRGRQPRGRGRERGGRQSSSDFVDNRQLTQKEQQQRRKKFININQPLNYQTYQKKPQKKQQRLKPIKNEQKKDKFIKSDNSQSEPIQQEPSQQEYEQSGSGSYQDEIDEQIEEEPEEHDEEQYFQEVSQKKSISQIEQSSKKQVEPRSKKFNQQFSQQSTKMCSKKEFTNRMKIFMENNNDKVQNSRSGLKVHDLNLNLDTSKSFSIFELNKQTHLPDEDLALKKFQRSANRADDSQEQQNQTVYVPRSKQGLVNTMAHIKAEILDSDSKSAQQLIFPMPYGQKKLEFIQIYVFLWDRMRQMIKDITRLNEQCKHDNSIIEVCEQITRFFILSINEGRKKYENELDFDDKMNKESLIKIMTPLLGIYADSKMRLNKLIKEMQLKARNSDEYITVQKVIQRMEEEGIYISPNEPQITSYAILFSEDYRKYLYENIFVGLELQDSNPLYESKQIQQVLAIKSALSLRNYSKYFDMIESEDYEYLLSCLMVLNIHQIRKQTNDLLQNSFRHIEQGSSKKGVKKGVNESEFKKILRFEKHTSEEYNKFLRSIKAVSENGYVNQNKDMPDDQQIYKSPPYALDFKLKRKYFFEDQEKKDRNMKRSQIVSRSWKKSTYVEQLISCFLHKQYISTYVPKIKPIKYSSKQNEQKLKSVEQKDGNVVGPSGSGSSSSNTNKNDLLNAKFQELNRRKFLEAFSNKIADIFRPDQTKEDKRLNGAKNFFNALINYHVRLLRSSLASLGNEAKMQIEKEIYLIKFQKYMEIKKAFINDFKLSLGGQIQQKYSSEGITSLLKKTLVNEPGHLLSKKQLHHLPIMLSKSKIKQFNIKLYSDIAKNQPNYSLVQRIIKNILTLLVGPILFSSTSIDQNRYVYTERQIQIVLTVQILEQKLSNNLSALGVDSIIFLQTKSSPKIFSDILASYLKLQNCIRSSNLMTLPIAVIKLLSSTKYVQFDPLLSQPSFECTEFLRSSALQISPSLTLGLLGFMKLSVNRHRKRPRIEVKSLKHIIDMISLNSQYLQYLSLVSQQKQQQFLCHQQYINQCIEQVIRLSKMYYLSAGLFPNWTLIVQAIDHDNNNNNIKNHGQFDVNKLEDVMRRQYRELENIGFSLKFTSPFQIDDDKTVFNKTDFTVYYYNFCKKFDYKNTINMESIGNMVQILGIQGEKLTGDVPKFYNQLLTKLSELLAPFNIILPIAFKFYLSEEQLREQVQSIQQKIKNKNNRQQQKLKRVQAYKPQSMIMTSLDNSVNGSQKEDKDNSTPSAKRNRNSQFKYQRQEWIKQVRKQIKLL